MKYFLVSLTSLCLLTSCKQSPTENKSGFNLRMIILFMFANMPALIYKHIQGFSAY